MAQIKKPSILVVGSVNMDLVLKVPRIPRSGESLIGEFYQYVPGGKGANQAVAAARLGASVTFVGRIGGDNHGSRLKQQFHKEGICTDFLKDDHDNQTGLAVILLEQTGDNRILVYPGANMAIDMEDVERAFERGYHALMLQLEVPRDVVIRASRLAKEKNIPTILDAGPAQAFPLEDVAGLEVLTPNETETYALTGIEVNTVEDAGRAAKLLAEMSKASFVVIKMGGKGAVLYDNGNVEHFTAYSVRAVDTTAAGDAFTAAMATHYVKHRNIREAIRYANAVGALTVTRMGAQPSLPTFEEVEGFIENTIDNQRC
jgi:ribokinase